MLKIFEFSDQNNIYEAYYDQNFKFKKNGQWENTNSKEEKLLFKILFSLIPSPNTLSLGYTYYHNKCYYHLLDLKNNWHLFYRNGGLLPAYNDFLDLNFWYNNQEEYVTDFNDDKLSTFKEKIKRIIKIGDKVFLVTTYSIALIFAFTHYQEITKLFQDIQEPEYIYESPVSYNNDANLTVDSVVDLIKNNPNLNWQEKEYLSSFTDFFLDQLPYVDEKDLKENLNHMYTTYFYEHNPNCTGSWSYCGKDIYNIKIYESSSNDMVLDENDLPVLRHEFFHAWSIKGDMTNNLGRYFYEFVNSIMNNEYAYVNKTDMLYDWGYENNLGYVMLELFSPSTLHEFHAQKNCNVLVKELTQILPEANDGYQLINSFDEYYRTQSFVCNMSSQDSRYNDAYADYINSMNNLKQLLKRYYEAKYKKSIEDNLYVYYYYDPQACEEKIKSLLSDYQIFFVNPMNRGYINRRISTDYVINLYGSSGQIDDLNEGYDIFIDENGNIINGINLPEKSIGNSFGK